jgi:hypothetical protein
MREVADVMAGSSDVITVLRKNSDLCSICNLNCNQICYEMLTIGFAEWISSRSCIKIIRNYHISEKLLIVGAGFKIRGGLGAFKI